MFLILATELEKLARQRSTWMAAAFLNLVGIGVLLLVLCLPLIDALDPDVLAEVDRLVRRNPEQARSWLIFVFVLWANTFSLLSTFVLAMLAGRAVAGEFQDDSIQMYLLAPVHRLEVWLGKVLALVLVYALAWLLGLTLMGAAYLRMLGLQPGLSGLLAGAPVWKVFGAYALVDLSTLAFFLCLSALVDGAFTATLGGLGLYLASMGMDVFVWLFQNHYKTSRVLAFWHGYSFTQTARVMDLGQVATFLRQGGVGLPLRLDLLGANLAWMLGFLTLGYLAFSRRESRPES